MKSIHVIYFVTILLVVALSFVYKKQAFGYHIHYIPQKNSLRGELSELWLKFCPEIPQKSVEPNSVFGIVVAEREMLNDKFDVIMNTLSECNYDINQTDTIGLTPLHAAILYSDLIAIKKVISLGANTQLLLSGSAAKKYGEVNYLEFAKALDEKNPEIITYLSTFHY